MVKNIINKFQFCKSEKVTILRAKKVMLKSISLKLKKIVRIKSRYCRFCNSFNYQIA